MKLLFALLLIPSLLATLETSRKDYSSLFQHPKDKTAPRLEIPVACKGCKVNETIFIQNFVDIDGLDNSTHQDFMCGKATYPGHKGVDFRVSNVRQLKENPVQILAAASGRIKATRDGVPDRSRPNSKLIKNIECGNGVVIDHGNGWETQYCHMKKGSINVKAGQEIKAGEKIGEMGMSGKTEFPHLHLALRQSGEVIDPFYGEVKTGKKCGGSVVSYWSKKAEKELFPLKRTAILNTGFTNRPPKKTEVLLGAHQFKELPVGVDKILFWTDVMGLQKGDVIEILITDPDGKRFVKGRVQMKKAKAYWIQVLGRKRPKKGFKTGTYILDVTVKRPQRGDYKPVDHISKIYRVTGKSSILTPSDGMKKKKTQDWVIAALENRHAG